MRNAINLRLSLAVAVLLALGTPATFGTASALGVTETVLCRINQAPCAFGNWYTEGEEFKATAATSKFTINGGTGTVVVCTGKFINQTTATTGNPVAGKMSALTFEPCIEELTMEPSCSATAIELPYRTAIERKIMTPDGEMKVWAHEGGKDPRIRISCFSAALKCVYGAIPVLQVNGASPGEYFTTGVEFTLLFKEGTMACGGTMTWATNFLATEPEPFYVSYKE